MKQITNPFTGKPDYLMTRKEVAEELDMTIGQINHRWSKNPGLHKCFIPPRKISTSTLSATFNNMPC